MSTQTEQQPLTNEEIRAIREQVAVALRVVDYLQGCKIEYTNSSAKPDRRLAFLTEGLDKLPRLLDEIERLRAIEAQAIEQSEYVQRELLSPSEAEGLKREVERLRAELDRARWIPVTEKLPDAGKRVWLAFMLGGKIRTKLAECMGGNEWLLLDWGDGRIVDGIWATATHWMPLPPPPAQQSQEDN